jgi:hypothetical protein
MSKKLVAKKKAASTKPTKTAPTHIKKAVAQTRKLAKQQKAVKKIGAVLSVKLQKRGKVTDSSAPVGIVEKDTPHIDCRLLIGELSLPIDASNLERTVGAGRWGHGLGLVDQWPDAAWVGLLTYLKLPADPLDRSVADQPVKRLVQRLWYETIKGGVPENRAVIMAERDARRSDEYNEKFIKIKEVSTTRAEHAKTSFGHHSATLYEPTTALKDTKLVLGGQAAILLTTFKTNEWRSMTTAVATEGMLKAGLKTATKPERIAAFYLCQWVKKGLLKRV